jgi:hypothetical protein
MQSTLRHLVRAAALATVIHTHITAQPKDACALLKSSEIQALAGSAIGHGESAKDELGSLTCVYKWGKGINAYNGAYQFQVIIADASRMMPGTTGDMMRQGMAAEVKSAKDNAGMIPGVGEAAMFKTRPIAVETSAFAKGRMLMVNFEGPDARQKKDQVIALLKTAVGRL